MCVWTKRAHHPPCAAKRLVNAASREQFPSKLADVADGVARAWSPACKLGRGTWALFFSAMFMFFFNGGDTDMSRAFGI